VDADALLDEVEAALRERTHLAEVLATARALVEQRTAVSSPMQAELRVAEAELLKLEEAVSQAASALGLNNIDDAALPDLEASLDQADALHQERTRLAVTLSVASGLVESRKARAECPRNRCSLFDSSAYCRRGGPSGMVCYIGL
jgi:predicted phage gp36 major capsid-like protein